MELTEPQLESGIRSMFTEMQQKSTTFFDVHLPKLALVDDTGQCRFEA